MENETVIRVGIMSLEQIKTYIIAIASGRYRPSEDEPKIWFTSMKSFASVLSDENQELLRLIFDKALKSLLEREIEARSTP